MTGTMQATRPPALARAASTYATRLDWSVLPLAPRSKVPAIKGGRGCLDATTDPDMIRQWWEADVTRNVGIATGAASGLFAIDVDPRNGGDIALEQLEATHGPLPDTVEALTGGGGRHLLYRMTPALAPVTWSPIATGLDVKGDHAYIVAPPSIHPNGGVYAWEHSRHPLEVPIAEPPAWLVAMLTKSTSTTTAPRPPDFWRSLVCHGIDQGGRNHAVARLAGHLLRRHVDPFVALELLLHWNARRGRPPLAEQEVTATVNSIARKEAARRGALS
jgi:hypothetical protein